jgi:hypothetical protein
MKRTALLTFGVWLLGAGLAAAQGLPEGTFASSKEGCTKLQNKTPAELGEGLDFTVVSKTGVVGYLQRCDFVNVTAHNATSWLATAFCEESGYTYPDLFAIAQKDNGELSVTRLTSQQETYEGAGDDSSANADDLDPSEADRDDKAGSDKGAATGDQSADVDEQNGYVRCDHVKQ